MRASRQLGASLGRKGSVRALLAALQDNKGAISTVQLVTSGAVEQLRAYMQGADWPCPHPVLHLWRRRHMHAPWGHARSVGKVSARVCRVSKALAGMGFAARVLLPCAGKDQSGSADVRQRALLRRLY